MNRDTGLRSLRTELFMIDLAEGHGGTSVGNVEGTRHYFPHQRNPELLVVRVEVFSNVRVAGSGIVSTGDLRNVYLTLCDAQVNEYLKDIPAALLNPDNSLSTVASFMPVFYPMPLSAEQCYLFTTAPIDAVVPVQFTYAAP